MIWLGAWRVNGNLSVSRAIGDAKDKTFISGEADTVSSMYTHHTLLSHPLCPTEQCGAGWYRGFPSGGL